MTTNSTIEAQIISNKDLNIITESVNDIPLLIAQMVKMGLPKILDRHLPKSYNQRLSWGWTATVTNATQGALPLGNAVLCYRNEYRIERIFNRLKSRLNIAPLFVKRDDQIDGLTYLLTLGVRVLTLTEFVICRALQMDGTKLPGLHAENRWKETNKPTAERILNAFSGITLSVIKDAIGNQLMRWLSPLSVVQQKILNQLGLL